VSFRCRTAHTAAGSRHTYARRRARIGGVTGFVGRAASRASQNGPASTRRAHPAPRARGSPAADLDGRDARDRTDGGLDALEVVAFAERDLERALHAVAALGLREREALDVARAAADRLADAKAPTTITGSARSGARK